MEGTIFNIKRFAVHDGPGIRTTVFLKGCPLYCRWCHNPESRDEAIQVVKKQKVLDGRTFWQSEEVGKRISVETLMYEIEKERLVMEESGGGVTFSGGEPLFQPEFLLLALQACKTGGLHTAVDTSGYAEASVFEHMLPFTDLFLYDLKIMDEQLHQAYTGVGNRQIHRNLGWLAGKNANIIIRIPLLYGITATHENIIQIADFVSLMKQQINQIDLLPFHRIGVGKYRRFGIPYEFGNSNYTPDKEQLKTISGIFVERGFIVRTT